MDLLKDNLAAVFSNYIAIFVRADSDPNRVMVGVLSGEVVNIALDIIFVFPLQMGINLLTSYYLQSVLNTKKSLCISLLRNIILSGIAILVFPLLFGGNSLWMVMPVVEVIVFVVSIVFLTI